MHLKTPFNRNNQLPKTNYQLKFLFYPKMIKTLKIYKNWLNNTFLPINTLAEWTDVTQ